MKKNLFKSIIAVIATVLMASCGQAKLDVKTYGGKIEINPIETGFEGTTAESASVSTLVTLNNTDYIFTVTNYINMPGVEWLAGGHISDTVSTYYGTYKQNTEGTSIAFTLSEPTRAVVRISVADAIKSYVSPSNIDTDDSQTYETTDDGVSLTKDEQLKKLTASYAEKIVYSTETNLISSIEYHQA